MIERPLGAQRVAQYVMRGRCERFLRLSLFPSEAKALLTRFGVSLEPLSPLLAESGQRFERDRVADLARTERVVSLENRPPADFVREVLAQPEGRTFYDQPSLEGAIGPWPCEGRADLVAVTRGAGGRVDLTVVDIKASRRETVGYRLQVAFYARLLRRMFAEESIPVGTIRGAIAARDADFAADFPVFDLALYEDEVERLVAAPDADIARVAAMPFDRARYHLSPVCDSCAYNALCFAESAERGDLSLVPHAAATEKDALRAEGVTTVAELAGLMRYGEKSMEPEPGREAALRRIGSRWPLATRLPILAQRARAVLRRNDRDVEAKFFLVGSDFGTLPDPGRYPDLVRVFVDAQRDYLEDRLYLISALVVGPAGEVEVTEMLDAPPAASGERERDLLVEWMRGLMPAIASAAGSGAAPLHVYLYDSRDQRDLLAALERHFDALCAIPPFHDLLTSSPALMQPMISFLADEVRARLNLDSVCQNLYQVARRLGFAWRDETLDAPARFRTHVFDGTRAFVRDETTGALRRAKDGDDDILWVETGARFGTEIPLEYAYAAWGRLGNRPDASATEGTRLRGYLGVTPDDVAALGRMRCRALRHVEESFRVKNTRIDKTPVDLGRFDDVAAPVAEVPFSRALEDFLLLEHHASRQAALLHLALPAELRAQTGRSAVLLCEPRALPNGYAAFRFATVDGTPSAVASAERDAGALRFKAGDFMTLNPLVEDGQRLGASRLVHGRVVVIDRVDGAGLVVRLLSMNFKGSLFRYRHRQFAPEPGVLYTLDEMVDDLNADKLLEACQNADANPLYRWMSDPESGRRPRSIRPSKLRDAAAIADLAAASQAPRGLTAAQSAVIGAGVAPRVLVVQGPPGTGKSHTLGFAVLVRALALAVPGRPFRVAVAAKTHAATTIALESVARRARQLLDAAREAHDATLAPLARLRVFKICNDAGDPVPDGVERLLTDGGEDFRAPEQWEDVLSAPLVVIGGTPGGLYNLVKRGGARRGEIDWSASYFDLVVVDEASQMGIAEALTAAAFLREEGQFLAIGDHRQMPPILAHAWDRDSRRELARTRPHLAIFDYLRELGFPRAALDESFRVPAEVAGFLRRHVYSQDGVEYHSENRTRLPRAARDAPVKPWVAAALDPDEAMVVIEHDEAESQQANSFEAGLVSEIVRAARDHLRLDAERGVGVVVAHNAQKALLRRMLPDSAGAIDTVERFQGGERDLIVISTGVSHREFAERETSFLLEPRRLTVALSRPRRKVVVVCSRTVFDLTPSDLDEYERGSLWKHLRHEGSRVLWRGELGGHMVTVRGLRPSAGSQ
jgi:hypothetical protein